MHNEQVYLLINQFFNYFNTPFLKKKIGLKLTDEERGIHLLEILESRLLIHYFSGFLVTWYSIPTNSREKHDLNHKHVQ